MVNEPRSVWIIKMVTGSTVKLARSVANTRPPSALSRPSARSTKKAGLRNTCAISKRVHFQPWARAAARSKRGAGSGPTRAGGGAVSALSGRPRLAPRVSKRKAE